MKKIIFYILYMGVSAVGFTQDAHFSLYRSLNTYLNPAQTGINGNRLQVGGQYRSQWSPITTPYNTYAVQAQSRVKDWAFGGVLHKNSVGEASIATTGGWLSTALHKPLNTSNNSLSIGLGVGFVQKSFDPAAFTFESQYEEGTLIAESGENFERTSVRNADFSIGLNWQGAIDADQAIEYQLGFGLAHFHRPKMNFQQALSELPLKKNIYMEMTIGAQEQLSFNPHVLWQQQGIHQETLIGVRLGMQMPANRLLLGVATRIKDALILSTGIESEQWTCQISYDINVSSLKQATKGQGALEIAFTYHLDSPRKPPFPIEQEASTIQTETPLSKSLPCNTCPSDQIDTDGDGVVDAKDKCPYDPGYVYLEGCMDADKDGINDRDDGCPYLPGPQNNHGCPLLQKDSDGDGIIDENDRCVYLKGKAAFNGCPEAGEDGISDVEDHCPYLYGLASNNGCPANNSSNTSDHFRLIVEFDTDLSLIKSQYYYQLNKLIQKSNEIKEYHFVISGHTDTEGSGAYNYRLGQRRAQAIQDYLLQRGIPYDRIETYSYGEAIPLRENATWVGKARNRRAEVSLVGR